MQVPGTRHMEWGEQTVNERWAWSRSEGTLCDVYIYRISIIQWEELTSRLFTVVTLDIPDENKSTVTITRDSRKQEMFRIMSYRAIPSTRIVQVGGGLTWFDTNEWLKNTKKKNGQLKTNITENWKYWTLEKTWWYIQRLDLSPGHS